MLVMFKADYNAQETLCLFANLFLDCGPYSFHKSNMYMIIGFFYGITVALNFDDLCPQQIQLS